MGLEQRHIIKFLLIKGFKLGEIAKELSSTCGRDAYLRRVSNIGFIKSSSGEPISRSTMLVGHLSTMLLPKFYHFSENIHSLQGGRLLSP
jgi:hypothetical protein